MGIRPENFEDVSFVSADVKPKGLTFHADIDVIESLGAEKYVYFTRELGQTVNVAELEELARDAGRADVGGTAETVVARLDPATRIHEGQDAELWVDVRKLHVFDPATGRNLSLAARDDADGSTVQAGSAGSGLQRRAPQRDRRPGRRPGAAKPAAPGGTHGVGSGRLRSADRR